MRSGKRKEEEEKSPDKLADDGYDMASYFGWKRFDGFMKESRDGIGELAIVVVTWLVGEHCVIAWRIRCVI